MSGKRRGSFRRILAFLGLFLVALLTGSVGFIALASRAPEGIPAEGKLITVRAGEGASALASRLESEGALRSRLVFLILVRTKGLEKQLKTGTYLLKKGMDAPALLDLIVSGRQALRRVTFPEGLTLGQTAELVEAAGLASAADFVAAARDPLLVKELGVPAASLEGYLFPDTYFFPPEYGAVPTVRAMVAALRKRLGDIPEASSLTPEELHEKIILASIVEREYRLVDEAPLMASVFYNRLKIGMALQSCATVVYVITEKLGKPHPEVLYDRDIKIPDPYNTYTHRGLPPGPIANPGMTALRAVFYPARSKYLYFRLVDPEIGRHHFSESLDEHIGAASLFVKRAPGR